MDRLFLFLIIGALVVLVTALLLALGNPVFSFNGCLAPAGGPSVKLAGQILGSSTRFEHRRQ
jgi:hypothetical protein